MRKTIKSFTKQIQKVDNGLRILRTAIAFKLVILNFLSIATLIALFSITDKNRRRKRYIRNAHFHSKLIVKILNLKPIIKNKPKNNGPFLFVSNHYGTVDVFVAATIFPMMFITSVENQQTPFLGLVMEMAGCLFVERRSRMKIDKELKIVIDALKSGHSVALYPEAKAWNAEEVLPFKRTLLTAAAHAGVPIQPAVVNIRSVNKEEFTMKWRDHVCWWGDMDFVTSITRLFALKELVVEVEFLESYMAKIDEDRGTVADSIRNQIVEKFVPVKK